MWQGGQDVGWPAEWAQDWRCPAATCGLSVACGCGQCVPSSSLGSDSGLDAASLALAIVLWTCHHLDVSDYVTGRRLIAGR